MEKQKNSKLNLLKKEYAKKYGYIPEQNEYLCSEKEFIDALEKCLDENIKVDQILKANNNNLHNQRLISSLKNATSSTPKRTEFRQDVTATQNINKIKYGTGSLGTALDDRNVVHEVNEIRTVQTSKRITKTRRAVIVRDSKERAPRTFVQKSLNFMSFVAVALVAIFLGIFAGNFYIASKTVIDYSNLKISDYEADYAVVYNANKTKDKSQISAANAYVIAEGMLIGVIGDIQSFSANANGSVQAKVSGIVQSQTIVKKVDKTESGLAVENITAGLISTAEKTVYNYANKKVDSFVTSKVEGTPPTAVYKDEPTTTYDVSTEDGQGIFSKEYGIYYNDIFPYIVSEKTVDSSVSAKQVEKGYEYKISLNTMTSVLKYIQYMAHTSGLTRPPTFYEQTITFTIDDDFRFVDFYIYERYQIYYMGLPAECVAETTYTFSY